MTAPLIAIDRHRLATDGAGVTTLVAFHGCPLRCRYCINRSCQEPDGVWRTVTPAELLSLTLPDDLYFQATGGGICFGGGEPMLRADFISEFRRLCPAEWRIYAETSLAVEQSLLATAAPAIDHYFVDVKDMNPAIYRDYTGSDNRLATANLHWLADQGLADRVTIRLPLIPEYNTDDDRQRSREQLTQMGYTDFDCFDYIVR